MRTIKWINILCGLVISIIFFLLSSSSLIKNIENKVYDWLIRIRGTREVSSKIIIVNIDESSVKLLKKRWPWSRRFFADAIKNLAKCKPAVIALDLLFTEASNKKADEYLAGILKKIRNKVPVVLAMNFFYGQGRSKQVTYSQIGMELPLEILRESSYSGFINIPADQDDFIRQALLRKQFQGKEHQSFAYAVAEKAGFLTNRRQLNINFAGPQGSFRQISFYQVLQDNFSASFFKDKIVLIGVTALSINNSDYHMTPFFGYRGQEKISGIEIHANIIDTIIQKKFLLHKSFISIFMLILINLVILICFFYNLSIFKTIIISGSLIISNLILSLILFFSFQIIVFYFLPVLNFLCLLIFYIIMKMFTDLKTMGKEKAELLTELTEIRAKVLKKLDGILPDVFFKKYQITEREKDIIYELALNQTQSQIAKKLFISVYTVKDHLKSIYSKFGLTGKRIYDKKLALIKIIKQNMTNAVN